jgi:hypothetical protein
MPGPTLQLKQDQITPGEFHLYKLGELDVATDDSLIWFGRSWATNLEIGSRLYFPGERNRWKAWVSLKFEADLRRIYQLILSGAPLEAEARLVPGTPVRVRRGPFEGMSGVIIRRRGQYRLLIAVNFLQQGASVLIDQYDVEEIY